jgi:hypothetical protein
MGFIVQAAAAGFAGTKLMGRGTSEVEMRCQVEIDQVSSAEWAELLTLFADANIYQTWSYGAIRWGENSLSHLVLKRAGEVVGMAQLRIIHLRPFRSGIAYLRWGPVCHRLGKELEPEVLHEMAQALHDEYVGRRRLFLRVLPNAFDGSERAKVFRSAFSQFTTKPDRGGNGYRTLVVDLAPSLDELRKRLDQKWRNQLNRAEKNGLKLIEGNDGQAYHLFASIYKEMWARKKFETSVDVDEFSRIQESLAESERMKVLICSQGDTPVAGIVCSKMGNTAIYLLGATSDSGLQAKGAYLLQWAMIQRLKADGVQFYDLGGINPESNPGVYHFKQGLSGQDVWGVAPFESCEDSFSSICMKAADLAQGGLRGALGKRSKGAAGTVSQLSANETVSGDVR